MNIRTPWEVQKNLVKAILPTQDEVRFRVLSLQHARTRYITAFLYLTGCRVGECVQANDGLPVIKREKVAGFDCLVFVLRNEKNLREKKKQIPVKFLDEPKLCKFVWKNKNMLMVFPGKRRIEQILDNELGWNPHYFRHLRLSHLVTARNFTDQQLKKWAGWTDSRPASMYSHLRIEDLV